MAEINEREVTSTNEVLLHPLVIVNITDHFTRLNVNAAKGTRVRAVGALLGQQTNRRVEIFTSFEGMIKDNGELDAEFMKERKDMFNQVFPTYEILGWYATGSSLSTEDLASINRPIRDAFNDSPFVLLMDTTVGRNSKVLPVYIYETLLKHQAQGKEATATLQKVRYLIESEETERIGVDMAMHVDAAGENTSTLVPHAERLQTAVGMLNERISVLVKYLERVKAGAVPPDYEVLRRISSVCHQLPCADSPSFQAAFQSDYDDALLVTYLSEMTKGTAALSDVVEKSAAFSDRRRPTFIF